MVLCQCIKNDGQQCTRNVSTKEQDKRFCYQHQGCNNVISVVAPIKPLIIAPKLVIPLKPLPPAPVPKIKLLVKKPTDTSVLLKPPLSPSKKLSIKGVITITFGDQGENHKGMQIIGTPADHGFSIDDLKSAKAKFEARGCQCELIDLNKYLPDGIVGAPASILIARQGINYLDGEIHDMADLMFFEQNGLQWDTKAKMYGKVVNKHARYNLTYDDIAQDPDYENGKGRIVPFKDIPLTNLVRESLPYFLGVGAEKLVAEGNKYYDVNTCGISYHGDGERKKVIAIRLGQSMPLHYQWYQHSTPLGARVDMILNHGDLYVMSEKAVGFDWKCPSKVTLRHAAGCAKMTAVPEKKVKPKSFIPK